MTLLASVEWTLAGACLAGGVTLGYALKRWLDLRARRDLRTQEEQLLQRAQREADTLLREARVKAEEENLARRRTLEEELSHRQGEVRAEAERLAQREGAVAAQERNLVENEQALARRQAQAQAQETQLGELARQRRELLSHAAHLTEAEARAAFLHEIEEESRKDAADLCRHRLEAARADAEAQARRIIATAVQRYAAEHAFENTTATVSLNGHDIKGRIIGREGRNIRAFEAATGVTVLIDDTPGTVVLSGFDPVRREIARESMERLIADGRIHPTRIEEVVKKVEGEIEEAIVRAGEEAVLKVGLPPMHPEIVKVLGRLRFRYSYSQNILDHAIEVAHLAGLLAAELGADVNAAKRGGLLHDLGKALNHEIEGSHAQIGADLVRRCGEAPEVVEAVAAHHGEQPCHSLVSLIVCTADAISAARPGARSESMTTYLKRLEDLERIGLGFTGVEKCYAIQAGREVRVVVKPDAVDDQQAYLLARNIAHKIEEELLYPGQIRVTVVRETRCVEFAK